MPWQFRDRIMAWRPERRAADDHQDVMTIATTATSITNTDSQPRTLRLRLITKGPITSGRTAISIITAIIGTEMTPLMTALQNKALIVSIGLNPTPPPPPVPT